MRKIILCAIALFLSTQAFATIIREQEQTCSVCQAKNQYTKLASTNQFFPSSLDGRPGEDARNAIMENIQKCPTCGLVSYDVSKKLCENQDKIVRSPEYQSLLNAKNVNELSQKYLAYAHLSEKCGKDKRIIANAYLQAAWAADDKKEKENAIQFRKKVISYLTDSNSLDDKILLLDLYRRTSQFQKGLELIPQIKVDEKNKKACLYNGLVQHQKELLEKQYTQDERMINVLYCPPEPKSEFETVTAIMNYTSAIERLKRRGEKQKVLELEYRLIPLLEKRTQFRDRFILAYLYYQTNQLEKAREIERELNLNVGYSNTVLRMIEEDMKHDPVPDTIFYNMAKKMIENLHEAIRKSNRKK